MLIWSTWVWLLLGKRRIQLHVQTKLSVCRPAPQLKERYTSMRPYGEWLAQETVTMQDLMDSVPPEQRVPPPVLPAGVAPAHSNGASAGLVRPGRPVFRSLQLSLVMKTVPLKASDVALIVLLSSSCVFTLMCFCLFAAGERSHVQQW